jgi:hypothetical protein
MRIAPLLVLLLAAPGLSAADDPRPRKGDTVVARGCLGGGVLETLDLKTTDGKAREVAALTFRLTGDKKLLKTLKEEHTDHSDSITGVLKTDLPDEKKAIGTRIGNTSIGIGIANPNASTQRALPVLEVKAFEHTDIKCR